jgi:hypothetical protein
MKRLVMTAARSWAAEWRLLWAAAAAGPGTSRAGTAHAPRGAQRAQQAPDAAAAAPWPPSAAAGHARFATEASGGCIPAVDEPQLFIRQLVEVGIAPARRRAARCGQRSAAPLPAARRTRHPSIARRGASCDRAMRARARLCSRHAPGLAGRGAWGLAARVWPGGGPRGGHGRGRGGDCAGAGDEARRRAGAQTRAGGAILMRALRCLTDAWAARRAAHRAPAPLPLARCAALRHARAGPAQAAHCAQMAHMGPEDLRREVHSNATFQLLLGAGRARGRATSRRGLPLPSLAGSGACHNEPPLQPGAAAGCRGGVVAARLRPATVDALNATMPQTWSRTAPRASRRKPRCEHPA